MKIWFPAKNNGSPEIYTTADQNGLRAIWMRQPVWGNLPPIKDRYFAIVVQLYDYCNKPKQSHFTGVRTVKSKSFWSRSTTENLVDTEIKFVNAPERKTSQIYPAITPMHM